jgi:transposase
VRPCLCMTTSTEINQALAVAKGKPTIKLGMDVHADQITICRQLGGMLPQPAQKMSWEKALKWIKDQTASAEKIYSCYEAGPCGYGLHRRLVAMGVENFVVAPQRWDERGRHVKTDRRDARELVNRLERYVNGNRDAFSVVRVPSPEEEVRRRIARQRMTILKERNRCVLRGRGLMLAQGVRAPSEWWHTTIWLRFRNTLPEWLREQVELWQQMATTYATELKKWDKKVTQLSAGKELIKGFGALSDAIVNAEIADWHRFQNKRQAGSFTGLCPSEASSGAQRKQGSINKHGNPRVRHLLVESVWRLEKWQPAYPPIRLLKAQEGSRARKRAAVAVARRLAIDLWRIATNQSTAKQLGLKMTEPAKA